MTFDPCDRVPWTDDDTFAADRDAALEAEAEWSPDNPTGRYVSLFERNGIRSDRRGDIG